MNREIKFRAWNTAAKTMYPLEHFAYRLDGVEMQLMGRLDNGDTVWAESQGSMVFMQYTGLKDRNGVEVYEGDVVSCPVLVNRDVHGDRINRKVMWKNHQWVLDSSFAFMRFEDALDSEDGYRKYDDEGGHIIDIEVIGNIYENPELLENKS